MIKRIREINEVLLDLLIEIICYGVILQLTGVWFVDSKVLYSTGLWIGIVAAALMAVHMAVTLDHAMYMDELAAQKKISGQSAVRYLAVTALLVIVMFFHLGYLISCFLGLMGLKIAAYLQPQTHKYIVRILGRSDGPERS